MKSCGLKEKAGVLALVLAIGFVAFGCNGCAENNEPSTNQSAPTSQENENKQDQRTAGTVINDNRINTVNVYNGGPRGNEPSRSQRIPGLGSPTTQPLSLTRTAAGDASQADDGGYTQSGLSISVAQNTQTGGTSPNIGTGAATGTQSASPSQTAPFSATQNPSASVPVVLQIAMPGSQPQGSANSSQGTNGGTADQQPTTTQSSTPNNAGQLSPVNNRPPITISINPPAPVTPPAETGGGS